jgi:hypothetical protein
MAKAYRSPNGVYTVSSDKVRCLVQFKTLKEAKHYIAVSREIGSGEKNNFHVYTGAEHNAYVERVMKDMRNWTKDCATSGKCQTILECTHISA